MFDTCKWQAPYIQSQLVQPAHELERLFAEQCTDIEAWLRKQWLLTPAPITSSVDLRNAGFKAAPVDTNLFPAGFNNLNEAFLPIAVQACQATLEQQYPHCQRILLIPENHTRNQFYLENVAILYAILVEAGYQVRIGSMLEELKLPQLLVLPSKKQIVLEPIERNGNCLQVGEFTPDLILLNNDISGVIPALLQQLQQPVVPSLHVTWAKRLKSTHFGHYSQVCDEFAQHFAFDPWLIAPLFSNCGTVDFMQKTGEECLVIQANQLFSNIQAKYQHYGITQKPFLIVKADAGSYGMGVMTIYSADELKHLNRKQRTKMSSTKSGQQITKIILQEGVPSIERWHNETEATCEPVIYMIGHYVIGGFYRMHAERGVDQNLNAPGMQFQQLAFTNCCHDKTAEEIAQGRRFYLYSVLARLALVSAAREVHVATQSGEIL